MTALLKFKDIARKVIVLNKGRETTKSRLLETIEIVRARKRLKTTSLFKSLQSQHAPRKSLARKSSNSNSDKPGFKPLARGEFETVSLQTEVRRRVSRVIGRLSTDKLGIEAFQKQEEMSKMHNDMSQVMKYMKTLVNLLHTQQQDIHEIKKVMKDCYLIPKDKQGMQNYEIFTPKPEKPQPMAYIQEDEKESILETDSFSGNDFLHLHDPESAANHTVKQIQSSLNQIQKAQDMHKSSSTPVLKVAADPQDQEDLRTASKQQNAEDVMNSVNKVLMAKEAKRKGVMKEQHHREDSGGGSQEREQQQNYGNKTITLKPMLNIQLINMDANGALHQQESYNYSIEDPQVIEMAGNRFQSRLQSQAGLQRNQRGATNQSDSTMQNATQDAKLTDFSGNKTRDLNESKESQVLFEDLPNTKSVQPARKTVAFSSQQQFGNMVEKKQFIKQSHDVGDKSQAEGKLEDNLRPNQNNFFHQMLPSPSHAVVNQGAGIIPLRPPSTKNNNQSIARETPKFKQKFFSPNPALQEYMKGSNTQGENKKSSSLNQVGNNTSHSILSALGESTQLIQNLVLTSNDNQQDTQQNLLPQNRHNAYGDETQDIINQELDHMRDKSPTD